eukprot:m.118833 g.118833  ORF g.118833 m.118833 type:complete len:59 (-) comp15576_c0_seq1:100-276(-)
MVLRLLSISKPSTCLRLPLMAVQQLFLALDPRKIEYSCLQDTRIDHFQRKLTHQPPQR